MKDLVDARKITLVTGFSATAIRAAGERVVLEGETAGGLRALGPVDRIIVATGQRPDLTLTRELRIELDPWLESARALGPLIDPNIHSCGSVPPHGHRELSHPEAGFYTVGVKSYGRAPTFLLMTGYEQVRSVAAAIAGDMEAADDVRLVLPETGVCATQFEPVNAVPPSAAEAQHRRPSTLAASRRKPKHRRPGMWLRRFGHAIRKGDRAGLRLLTIQIHLTRRRIRRRSPDEHFGTPDCGPRLHRAGAGSARGLLLA